MSMKILFFFVCVTLVHEYGLEIRIGRLPLYAFWPKSNGPYKQKKFIMNDVLQLTCYHTLNFDRFDIYLLRMPTL